MSLTRYRAHHRDSLAAGIAHIQASHRMPAVYDLIGSSYGATRRADAGIVRALMASLQPCDGASYLDLGCGTGNYTVALANGGGRWHGVDPSAQMLGQANANAKAKASHREPSWTLARAASLPYGGDTFDGVVCTLAIHHVADLELAFAEVHRVLRRGRFVIFTAFPEQMQAYWLCHYFPRMMERSWQQMPGEAAVANALNAAGFAGAARVSPFEVTDALQDLFLYSGKHQPARYLDAAVRANISSFALHCPATELSQGLASLRDDVVSGRFEAVAKSYAGARGDYALVEVDKAGS